MLILVQSDEQTNQWQMLQQAFGFFFLLVTLDSKPAFWDLLMKEKTREPKMQIGHRQTKNSKTTLQLEAQKYAMKDSHINTNQENSLPKQIQKKVLRLDRHWLHLE